MKLGEFIKMMDGSVDLTINGEKHDGKLTQEMLDAKIMRIDVKLQKSSSQTLEDLGYSFEVGI